MAERRENSVLFSLRELRNIEEERVKTEEEAEQSRVEAERKAREDEIRRAKEAEEAKVRAEQDRVRKQQEDRDRVVREEELRLKESERRAQIEAATKLEQHRIEAEARARVDSKPFPTGKVVGGVVGIIAVALIAVVVLVQNHNRELAEQKAAIQANADAERKALVKQQEEEQRKLNEELADLKSQLDKASNDAERAQIRAKMLAASESHSKARAVASKKEDAPKTPKAKSIKTDTSDPLGGLNL